MHKMTEHNTMRKPHDTLVSTTRGIMTQTRTLKDDSVEVELLSDVEVVDEVLLLHARRVTGACRPVDVVNRRDPHCPEFNVITAD